MKTRLALASLALLLALTACHSQPTAGGLSAEDERALDNAAAMLDDNTIAEMSAGARADNSSAPSPDVRTSAPAPVASAPAPAYAGNATHPPAGNRSGPRP